MATTKSKAKLTSAEAFKMFGISVLCLIGLLVLQALLANIAPLFAILLNLVMLGCLFSCLRYLVLGIVAAATTDKAEKDAPTE